MTTAEQYKKFEELDKLASQGGGVERVERQQFQGDMCRRYGGQKASCFTHADKDRT